MMEFSEDDLKKIREIFSMDQERLSDHVPGPHELLSKFEVGHTYTNQTHESDEMMSLVVRMKGRCGHSSVSSKCAFKWVFMANEPMDRYQPLARDTSLGTPLIAGRPAM